MRHRHSYDFWSAPAERSDDGTLDRTPKAVSHGARRRTPKGRGRRPHLPPSPQFCVFLPILPLVLTLAGCAAVGPDYVPVEPNAPKQWHTELQRGLSAEPVKPERLAQWWTVLNDAQLAQLEERAVKANLDLKTARARVREARALRAMTQAGLFPTLDAEASFSRYRGSEHRIEGVRGFSEFYGKTRSLYSTSFDAAWELDVFGGVRREVEAAQANLEASQEQLHDVLVSLSAEVALNYLEVRTYQARLAATRANLKAQQHTYDLNRSRYEAGIIDELAVQQARYNLEHTRSLIPALETGLEAAKNRLAVLLGEAPGALHAELADTKPIPAPPAEVAVGVPADTVRHRPDIRAAERELAAQTAEIGVAKADLYPKFQLTGSIGLEAAKSNDFFKSGSRAWSVGPGISWAVFHAGAIVENIKVQTARQKQALLEYQSAVLRALEDVENVLVAYAKEQQRRESLIAAVAAARKAYELAEDRYKAGLVDFSNVLDAQRALLSFQDELAQSEGAVTSNLVRLYKALGGGWHLRSREGLSRHEE